MNLAPGTRIGPYEVVSLIGAGGMGEVYLARDGKLQRHVALKILPDMFAADPERLARFEREARTLAALNHAYIAAIYGFEESNGLHALALEFVDGETVADRIACGPIPIAEALPIARQIAEALEAAHEQGIIHRDLKPANIKVRPDGTIKVLDFGLAKALEPIAADRRDAMLSPTITSPALTHLGIILGTASYMSPEQAKGRPADKRSDIWAFGCVLFEMVSGKRPFDGEEVTETLAAVLKDDPDWTALPANLPPSIRTVIQGCLKRDRRERIADISTARFLLIEPHESPPVAVATAASPRWIWKAVGLLVLGGVLGGIVVTGLRQLGPSPVLQVTRFRVPLPEGQQFTTFARRVVTISPDGTTVAFTAGGRLYLRAMSDLEPRLLAGAERAISPAFSSDSQSLAFWADGEIKRIAVSGGVPVSLYRTGTSSAPSSLTWEDTGILFPQTATGIMRLSPNGGKPEVLVPLSMSDGFAHGPQLLPDGETLLFTLTTDSGASIERWDNARIVAHSLKTGRREAIIEPGTDARYVQTGHIVYALGGTVFAVPFDLATRKVTGATTPVIDGVMRVIADSGTAQFAFSNSGSLVYVKGPRAAGEQQLFLFDRAGVAEPLKLAPGPYRYPRVSPDGTRIAVESTDVKESFVSIYELSGTSSARRLTYGGNYRFPIWSRDGKHVVFQSDYAGDPAIFWQPVDGGVAERLTTPDPGTSHVPEAWSPTEDVLLFNVVNKSKTSLWMMSMHDRKPVRFDDVTSTVLPTDAVFSPDGHWVAYQAGESGSGGEGILYVQPFPPTGMKLQIARQAGRPLWSRDGKQLFFIPAPGQLMVVSITSQQPTFTFTDPVSVPRGFGISGPLNQRMFDITRDGRMLGLASPASAPSTATDLLQMHVFVNWTEELKQRVPTK